METTKALIALRALSHETRLEVFRLLIRMSPDPMPAGDIADRLGVVQNTMSSHLAELTRAGLITSKREGRSVRYKANYAAIRKLLIFLMRDCCQGNAEICAPLFKLVDCRC